MSGGREEQFLRHLQQFCQRLLSRRQPAKSRRNGWHTDFIILFAVFIILFFVLLVLVYVLKNCGMETCPVYGAGGNAALLSLGSLTSQVRQATHVSTWQSVTFAPCVKRLLSR